MCVNGASNVTISNGSVYGTSSSAVYINNSSATLTIGSTSHTLTGDPTDDPGPYLQSTNGPYVVRMYTQGQTFNFYSGVLAKAGSTQFFYGTINPRSGYKADSPSYTNTLLSLVPIN